MLLIKNKKRACFRIILFVPCFILACFLVNRAVSPWHVIQTFELTDIEKTSITPEEMSQMIRVGCYNIAHGRGPVPGSRNWDGGDKTAKLQRLKEIARVLKDSRLDVVVLNEASGQ